MPDWILTAAKWLVPAAAVVGLALRNLWARNRKPAKVTYIPPEPAALPPPAAEDIAADLDEIEERVTPRPPATRPEDITTDEAIDILIGDR